MPRTAVITGASSGIGAALTRAFARAGLFGALELIKAVLPQMRERGSGRILNVSSVAGTVGTPTMAAYSGSKFALEGFRESLAQDLRHLGIKVTIVQPASYETGFGAGGSGPANPMPEQYGPARTLLYGLDDYKCGDLAASADAIVSIAGTDHPPLRLALGHGLHLLRGKLTAQLEEYDHWEELTATTL